ncbi:MAG: TIGR02677 family protein [Filifactor alocis]|nr:TIGR02677 family protein [Filifactor alocis]
MARISNRVEDYKKITEANYLVAPKNAERYRMILRYFFVEHERMRDYIYPENVLEHVQGILGRDNYSEEELTQDLKQLVEWKNIVPGQEIKNPRTIAEFNRKVFRYQITSYTVQIERMLEQLEKSGEEFRGSLDKKPFEKLYLALRDFLEEGPSDNLVEYWHQVMEIFTSVRENTADYLAYLSSEKAGEMMKRESFFAYKEKFISYLRDFIQGSYRMAVKIQELLEKQEEGELQIKFDYLARVPDFTPRFEDVQTDVETKTEELRELWLSIVQWFVQTGSHPSQYRILQERTNATIRTITANIRRIGERNRQKLSRKKDYLHVAKWFLEAETMEEAHCISSVIFGLQNTAHYYALESETSNIYEEIWNIAPNEIVTNKRVRGGQTKTKVQRYHSNMEEKMEIIRRNQDEHRRLREEIDSHIRDGRISVCDGKEVSTSVRKVLLKWLSTAMLTEDGTVLTEFGYRVKVRMSKEEKIRLESEDGSMELSSFDVEILEGRGYASE